MSAKTIFANNTIALSEFLKKPADCFGDEPIAVLSHNKALGYVIGAEAFEHMLKLLEVSIGSVKGQFRPSAVRLRAIAVQGADLLLDADDDELSVFSE